MRTSIPRVVVWAAPALVAALVVAADLIVGRDHSVSTLVMISPLLASSLLGALPTAGYGLLAVAVWASLGQVDGQFAAPESRSAVVVRLVGIVVASVIAVVAATARVARETRLTRIERVADVAQRAILLPVPEVLGPVRIAARYESSAPYAAVGGDFYAAMPTPYGTRVLVGDVRGKGLDAVQLAAEVLGAFRERAAEQADVAALLERLHTAASRRTGPGDFVTAVLVQITDTGQLSAVTAGHPPPVLGHAGGARLLEFDRIRPPLGLPGHAEPITVSLCAGDVVLLYTDGATEARRPGDRRFRDVAELLDDATVDADPARLVDRVFRGLYGWTAHHLDDDVAVVALQYRPATPLGGAEHRSQQHDADGMSDAGHMVGQRPGRAEPAAPRTLPATPPSADVPISAPPPVTRHRYQVESSAGFSVAQAVLRSATTVVGT